MSDNKITVSTTGDFMLQDPSNGSVVEAYGTSTVENTAWVQQQIARGTLSTKEKGKVDPAPEPNANPTPGVDTGSFSASTNDSKKVGLAKRSNPNSVVSG